MKGHRLVAALYDPVNKLGEGTLRPVRAFVAGGATGRVLEVGCGTGANLPFYRWDRVESLEATEPDQFMLRRAVERAQRLGLSDRVRFQDAPAEALPFPDHSFDTVVASLVLCTVDDQDRSLAEIGRVLRPDGMLRIVEHVRGDGLAGRFHDAIAPAWGYFAGGCRPNRRTAAMLRAAGFEMTMERWFTFGFGVPAFVGVARLRA